MPCRFVVRLRIPRTTEQRAHLRLTRCFADMAGVLITGMRSYTMEDTTNTRRGRDTSSNPLLALNGQGQSLWLDHITRDLVRGGELQRLIDEDGLCGQTSNPTIFQEAIAAGAA